MKNKIILATCLLTTVLWPDFTLEYQMENKMKQVVQYKDAQHVKIMTGGEKGMLGGQLIVGEKRYMVMKQGEETKYMDMDVMMEKMKEMAKMFGGALEEEMKTSKAPEFKVIKKGEKKKVAGVDAQVWTVEVEEEGKKERMDVVVTNDSKIVDAIHKYTDVMKQFTQMDGEEGDALSSLFNIAEGYVVVSFDGMKLVKYDGADIPDSVFVLPAGTDIGEKLKKIR